MSTQDNTYFNQQEINELFSKACANGDLDLVKYLVASPELAVHAEFGYGEGFLEACDKGHAQVVDYLLNSLEAKNNEKEHRGILFNYYNAFSIACYKGYLDIVKITCGILEESTVEYSHNIFISGISGAISCGQVEVVDYLLTDEKSRHPGVISNLFMDFCKHGWLEHVQTLIADPVALPLCQGHYFKGLRDACQAGHLAVVQYLTQSDILQWESICNGYNSCLVEACKNDHLAVAQHILSSEALKPYLKLNALVTCPLMAAFNNHHHGLVQYLLHDYNYPVTYSVEQFFAHNHRASELKTLFENRDLKHQLQAALSDKKPIAKPKI